MMGTHLTPQEKQALQSFVYYLQKNTPDQVHSVALFGSKARGDSQPDSDIDVLVITEQEDRQLRRAIIKQAARISLAYDVLLSPRVIGAQRWEQMRSFSLYRNVIREATGLDIVRDRLTFEPVELGFKARS